LTGPLLALPAHLQQLEPNRALPADPQLDQWFGDELTAWAAPGAARPGRQDEAAAGELRALLRPPGASQAARK